MEGKLLWFDPTTGRGRVVAGRREYPVDLEDISSEARAPGAAVRFDVRREGGVEQAVHVELREGLRTSRKQGRFGTMAGSGRPQAKGREPLTRGRPDRESRYTARPADIVERWVRAANSGSLASALPLYAPDAVLHRAGQDHEGRPAVRRALADGEVLAYGWDVRVRGEGEGDGDTFVVERPSVVAGSVRRSRFRVTAGEITEQWIE